MRLFYIMRDDAAQAILGGDGLPGLEMGQVRFVLAHGAAGRTARWWRAPAAPLALLAVPGARGYAPLPPVPYPRQAELAGFCALSRACCASRMELPACLCWRMGRCAVGAGAWCCTLYGALVARSRRAARAARGPRGRGATRPYPRSPTRGKLSLQAFARCRARAALRAGVSVLAHGATRPCVPFSLAFFGLILPLLRGSFIASLTVLFLCFL